MLAQKLGDPRVHLHERFAAGWRERGSARQRAHSSAERSPSPTRVPLAVVELDEPLVHLDRETVRLGDRGRWSRPHGPAGSRHTRVTGVGREHSSDSRGLTRGRASVSGGSMRPCNRPSRLIVGLSVPHERDHSSGLGSPTTRT